MGLSVTYVLYSAQFVSDQTTDDITPLGLRAPEVVLGGEWNESVDIWTFGCMVSRSHIRCDTHYELADEDRCSHCLPVDPFLNQWNPRNIMHRKSMYCFFR